MTTWSIGDVTVTKVKEAGLQLPMSGLIPEFTPEELESHRSWLVPDWLDDEGHGELSVHTLLVESAGTKIMVDSCLGPGDEGWQPTPGPGFLDKLTAVGFGPEDVDVVACTHMHHDHVGWHTTREGEEWIPTFPNARYVMAGEEWEFWRHGESPLGITRIGETITPLVDHGVVDLVDADHGLTDEVAFVPTPGHTPGHVSVRISSSGADAVITGDMAHHPIELAEPQWDSLADVDHEPANETRAEFVEEFVDSGVLVIGTHFSGPTAGYLVREPEGVRFRAG